MGNYVMLCLHGVKEMDSVQDKKRNEITAISKLLEKIQIKQQIITIDAIGIQKAIAETIQRKRGEHILALKKNQGRLYEDVSVYFSNREEKKKRFVINLCPIQYLEEMLRF